MDHFNVVLFALHSYHWPEKITKSKIVHTGWSLFANHDIVSRHVTSTCHFVGFKGVAISSLSFRVRGLIFSKLRSPLPVSEDQTNKPSLNQYRVNHSLSCPIEKKLTSLNVFMQYCHESISVGARLLMEETDSMPCKDKLLIISLGATQKP